MENDIRELLLSNFQDAEIIVHSADGTHFEAIVVTDVFQDKKPIERQKMVYSVVGSHIVNGAIHALSLKTLTKQEWQERCVS